MKTLLPLCFILSIMLVGCCEDDPIFGPSQIDIPKKVSIPDQNYLPGEIDILINGSYDGGVWWYPQVRDCNPNEDHQGKILFDILKSMDYKVDALCKRERVNLSDYENLSLLIVAGSFEYVDEITAFEIKEYVENGGNLFLMLTHSNHSTLADINSLTKFFDLTFAIPYGSELHFNEHSITNGIPDLPQSTRGMGLYQISDDHEIIANFSPETYIDENENGEMDENETSAPVFIGAKSFGQGKILFAGDLIIWYDYPALFSNAINWFELK